jgi:hypothetical protein
MYMWPKLRSNLMRSMPHVHYGKGLGYEFMCKCIVLCV